VTTEQKTGEAVGTGSSRRWLVLGIGVAAQSSFAAAFSGIPVTGPILRRDYHLTTGQLGLALGMISLGIAVTEIGWGILTDRLGERRVLLGGLLGTGVVLTAMAAFLSPGNGATVPAFAVVVGALFAVGVLGGSVNGSSGRAVMAWFAVQERGFAMSIRQTAIPAGGAIGAALLPWLAVSFGFRAVFGMLALFCFATAAATWTWLYDPAALAARSADGPGAAPPSVAPDESRPQPNVLSQWDIWRLALASFLLTVPQFAVLTFAAVFLTEKRGAAVAVSSACILIVQIGGAVARVWSGRWTDLHQNRRPYIRGVGALAAVAMAAAAASVAAPLVVVVAALSAGGLLASAWHGVAYTEIASMAGKLRSGTALGLENTTVFAAAFLTPVLIPVLLHLVGWWAVWAAAALASAVAVPLVPRPERGGDVELTG
jgi:sugar phosphate permease